MVLFVVDTQKLITNEKLYQFELFEKRIRILITKARECGVEVIYVRHNDGEGAELTKGAEGFEIYDSFKPMDGERIFDKFVNSPFKESGLLAYLKDKGEDTILAAEQTYRYYNEFMWKGRYAECVSFEEALAMLC